MQIKTSALLVSVILTTINMSAIYAAGEVKIPFSYSKGKQLFEKNCSACHGLKLDGTDQGPPLIHAFYKPSHHGDSAFYKAGLKGARAHHWNFGDMPPVKGMTAKKMDSIVPYVRFYQQQMKLY
jgi:cytochrome c2